MKKLIYLFFIIFPITFSYAAGSKVIILDLKNLTKNPNFDYLSTSLPKSLATTLKRNSQFQIMDFELVNQKLKKEKINKDNIEYKQILKIGDDFKANIVIQGNFILMGETIQINLEAIDINLRKIKIAESVNGEAGKEIFELVDEIVNKMSDRMTKELPSSQDEEQIIKEKINVETVYLSESRKDQWFFTQFGILANSSLMVINDNNIEDTTMVPVIGLGYGYRFIRLYFSGSPPLFKREEEGKGTYLKLENNFDINLQFEIFKRKLFFDTSFYNMGGNIHIENKNFNSDHYDLRTFLLFIGGTYSFLPKFYTSISVGFPLSSVFYHWIDDKRFTIRAENRVTFQAGIKWIFLGETGIQLLYRYYSTQPKDYLKPEESIYKPEISSQYIMLSLCYDVDF